MTEHKSRISSLETLCIEWLINIINERTSIIKVRKNSSEKESKHKMTINKMPPDLGNFREKITQLPYFNSLPGFIQFKLLNAAPLVPEWLQDRVKCEQCSLLWYGTEKESCDYCHILE